MKEAADQEISHEGLVSGQDNLGKEQTKELHDGPYGVDADTQAAANKSTKEIKNEYAGIVPLDQKPQSELSATGSPVKTVTTDGCDTGTPASVAKNASYYKAQLAQILNMSKTAAAKKQAQEPQQAQPQQKQASQAAQEPQRIVSATEVLNKIAALTQQSPASAFRDAQDSLVKLASTNPLFHVVKERIMMEKMAADISELAGAEGISPEEAAAELDAAQEANPEMAAELEGEAADEAVGELADIESTATELGPAIDQMAANASEALGTEVTADDILAAADEVTQQAEAMGVEPEELIQAALNQMQGGGEEAGAAGVDEEDLANAEEILQAGAEQGLSPEEVIQIAADMMEGGEGGEAAPAEAPAEKTASYKPQFTSPRAAYCAAVRAQR